MQPVTLQVDDEFKALGDAIAVAIADVKAKVGAGQEVTDVISKLGPAIMGMASFAGDYKKPANQAYVAYAIAAALEPVVPSV